jgi:hypothetical protein
VPRWSRPDRTVNAPDGGVWELYVSRGNGGLRWQPRDYDSSPVSGEDGVSSGALSLVGLIVEIPLFLFNQILFPAVRYLLRLPFGLVQSRSSDTWTVEAVRWWPREERYSWSVGDASQRERVLAEVASGITEGRWAQPTGAVFHGESTG